MRVLEWERSNKTGKASSLRWRYYLLVEDIEVEGFHCESYGVLLENAVTGEESRVRHVTVNAHQAVELLDILVRGGVTPVTLRDVIEDWLG